MRIVFSVLAVVAVGAAGCATAPPVQLIQARTARVAAEQKAEASEQKAEASEQKAGASDEKAAASEQRAEQANDALAKLSAKPDGRGMVITLAGNVLFRSNGVHLLPAAMSRLDEVASVLATQEQNVVVDGFTD